MNTAQIIPLSTNPTSDAKTPGAGKPDGSFESHLEDFEEATPTTAIVAQPEVAEPVTYIGQPTVAQLFIEAPSDATVGEEVATLVDVPTEAAPINPLLAVGENATIDVTTTEAGDVDPDLVLPELEDSNQEPSNAEFPQADVESTTPIEVATSANQPEVAAAISTAGPITVAKPNQPTAATADGEIEIPVAAQLGAEKPLVLEVEAVSEPEVVAQPESAETTENAENINNQDSAPLAFTEAAEEVAGSEAKPMVESDADTAQNSTPKELNQNQVKTDILETTIEIVNPKSAQPTSTNFVGSTVSPSGTPLHTTGATLSPVAQVSAVFASSFTSFDQEPVQTISLELHPAELGQLKITVEHVGDQLMAQIVASESASADLLTNEKNFLEEALAELGFGEANVDISNHDQQNTEEENSGQATWIDIPAEEVAETTESVTQSQASVGIDVVA